MWDGARRNRQEAAVGPVATVKKILLNGAVHAKRGNPHTLVSGIHKSNIPLLTTEGR